jgi:hypothetical protein
MPIVIGNLQPVIPPDGSTGQVLAKKSNNNFDTEWVDHAVIVVSTTAPSNTSALWIDIS